jgi:hypothetical protein
MNLRKAAILIGCVVILLGVCSPAAALPPGAETVGPQWLEGMWKLVSQESCARHTDGKSVGKFKEELFMQLFWAGDGYFGFLLLSQEATEPIGFAAFIFDVPLAEAETHLVRGEGSKFVITPFQGASGGAEFFFRGSLTKNAFRKFQEGMSPERMGKLQQESKMSGWIVTQFSPDDSEHFPFAHCGGTWEARWIGPATLLPN